MKNLLILLVFVSGTCFSQVMVFDFSKDKVCKITMKGADNFKKADHLSRLMEKMMVSHFGYVDTTNSTGYFIVDNFDKAQEIEKLIKQEKDIKFLNSEELQLTEDLFIDMYMKRGGFKPEDFSLQLPKKIVIGPFNDLTRGLYAKAVEIWEKKYNEN